MNQNKGIGAYRDRPGYFMGGMIGGAILGALVNKIQGKDWKKGALMGGIGGGIMGGMTGTGGLLKGMGAYAGKSPWMGRIWDYAAKNPKITSGAFGLGTAYLAGDPEYDERKIREEKERRLREQMARNRSFYPNWYTNPWTGDEMNPHGWNTGGAINARKGYYPGGDVATDMQYVDPDLYTPTGEGGGPSSNPILQIPMGPEGSFADEFEDFDYMKKADSDGDESGWYEMFFNEFGRPPVDIQELQLFIDQSDISPTDVAARGGGQGPMMAAEGGYKTRPQYRDAGPVDMPYDPEEEDKTYWERIIEKLRASEMLNTPNRAGRTAIDEWEQSEFNTAKWLQKVPVLRDIMDKEIEAVAHKRPMAFRAEGGIADLDMTGGGASFGPGTGTSDDIPAMLSDGEFVVTANAVQNLGGGDRMLGARRMYQMMNQLDPNSQTPAEMSGVGYA